MGQLVDWLAFEVDGQSKDGWLLGFAVWLMSCELMACVCAYMAFTCVFVHKKGVVDFQIVLHNPLLSFQRVVLRERERYVYLKQITYSIRIIRWLFKLNGPSK